MLPLVRVSVLLKRNVPGPFRMRVVLTPGEVAAISNGLSDTKLRRRTACPGIP